MLIRIIRQVILNLLFKRIFFLCVRVFHTLILRRLLMESVNQGSCAIVKLVDYNRLTDNLIYSYVNAIRLFTVINNQDFFSDH